MGALDKLLPWRRKGDASGIRRDASYFRNNASPYYVGWTPALRDTADDVRQAWAQAAARAIDSMQNSGFISGVVEKSTSAVVGAGLRLSARPDFVKLGWSEETSKAWAKDAAAAYDAWALSATDCDAGGRMTVGQMHQVAYSSYLAYGEVFGLLPILNRSPGSCPAKVMLLPPSRLSTKNDDVNRIVQGIKIDTYGFPISYLLTRKDQFGGMTADYELSARDAAGRRKAMHVITAGTHTTRGISPLAPALKVLRQLEQYCDATLTAALLQTIFAATIKTDIGGLQAYEGLMTSTDQTSLDLEKLAKAKADWYDTAKIDLAQHGRVAHLFPNEELEFHKAEHPGEQFDTVMRWLALEIASAAGVTYESATGDFRSATYSSVRMATSENWNIVTMRRKNFAAPVAQIIYECFLEDAIGSGLLGFPGGLPAFQANRAAASQAHWSGPPKPQADDLKTANAHNVLYAMGATTLDQICGDYGDDWEDVLEQRAREREKALSLGLPDPNEKIQQPMNDPSGGPGDPRGETGDRTDSAGGSRG